MTVAQVWSLKNSFNGTPKIDDFHLTEETLPELKDNEILAEALYLSIDPYFRLLASSSQPLPGEQVARVLASKSPNFPVGSLVCVHAGWRSHTVLNVSECRSFDTKVEVIEEVQGLSPSLWLGTVGMTGVTAYLGFVERCEPKSGETIVITAAAGAVGSVVGQLAKLQGLRVIGLAGSREKCEYLRSLGFDHAINYKVEDISQALDTAAPDGVDIYFDNVGGNISDIVYSKLRSHGRVLICGLISTYNTGAEKGKLWYNDILFKQLKVQGFFIFTPENLAQFPRVRKELISLITQGKIKTKEHVREGFKNMPAAFLELFTGENVGKIIVKV
ncbi:prostaglandin reductase 1-like [Physella acuta]|uniref:prostaglandin reductase 1-like n=1 Tax=Physella acuta TaxID=109671 RepID=UPI0027DB6D5F|nr:prostaglandin reductase 1-like [Physella acuta]